MLFSFSCWLAAQNLKGRVTDAKTGEGLPFVNVFYEGAKSGVQTDAMGKFSLPFRKGGRLLVSCVGYESYAAKVLSASDSLMVRLKAADLGLTETTITGRKKKYSRKDNPAVILMEKVIAAKKASNLKAYDNYSIQKYDKLTFALSDITPEVFQQGELKRFAFLKDHVEISPETGKLILPLTVDETVMQEIYRKRDDLTKRLIQGQRSTGMSELFDTGDIINSLLQDAFTEIDLYQDDIRFVQSQFLSPIATKGATAFYRYFIEDTTQVAGKKCIEVSFGPNNPRDFGFTGSLFITADSTFRIAKANISIPLKSTVNYITRMNVAQEYTQLPTGEQVLSKNEMFVVLTAAKFLKALEVKRITTYRDYSFEKLQDKLFQHSGSTKILADARMQEDKFWNSYRTDSLTKTENGTSLMVQRFLNLKGLKPFIWVGKSLIENYIPTSLDAKQSSKIDIGPVNTMITSNPVDGLRLRGSLQTTAAFNPHTFWRGYLAYGFRDQRWKGMSELTYSFNKKNYLPMEFPTSNLTFSYSYDVSTPSDQWLNTDKDNVFRAITWSPVKHMMYNSTFKLLYDREWENGLQWFTQLRHNVSEATHKLFYQPVAQGIKSWDENGNYTIMPNKPTSETWISGNVKFLKTTDLTLMFKYQPGVAYVNTKQRRILLNKEAPIYRIAHTVGLKGLESDYTYNLTELGVRKRFWLKSWGRMDFDCSAGAQWNSVPFPLLVMPRANLSYVYDDDMFYLVDNMEFLNDRYAQLMFNWNLHGKIFNRIPLVQKLKIREHIGFNLLWGKLTDKNNPYLERNAHRQDLYFFPGEFDTDQRYKSMSRVMNPEVPYMEFALGIHNIFKILHVDYVRRINYLENPDTQKWSIRFFVRVIF